jgi:hypothetical protein
MEILLLSVRTLCFFDLRKHLRHTAPGIQKVHAKAPPILGIGFNSENDLNPWQKAWIGFEDKAARHAKAEYTRSM